MSKVDAQRAMREARYARDNPNGPTRRVAPVAGGALTAPAAPTPRAKPAPAQAAPAAAAAAERCGHKSMNGRACTREAGHPEKNHRYS